MKFIQKTVQVSLACLTLMGANQMVDAIDIETAKTGKYVAFLFDDGPHETNGIKICEIAGSKGVPVSFAQIGKQIVKYPELTNFLKKSEILKVKVLGGM